MIYKEKIQKAAEKKITVMYDLLNKDNIVGIYIGFSG